MTYKPEKAMVLAAGLGKRMRPITETMPKPLVKVAGKPLLDWGLQSLVEAGVSQAVVNVHYLGSQIVDHLAGQSDLQVSISDETELLLDSAGGIIKALPLLGSEPFYLLNADTFWVGDQNNSNISALARAWDAEKMDILLMTAEFSQATGFDGKGDFVADGEGRLQRARNASGVPLIYAGAGIIHPRIFAGAEPGIASLNRYFDEAIAAGRLFGMPMTGHWLTVGTPEAIGDAEAVLATLVD